MFLLLMSLLVSGSVHAQGFSKRNELGRGSSALGSNGLNEYPMTDGLLDQILLQGNLKWVTKADFICEIAGGDLSVEADLTKQMASIEKVSYFKESAMLEMLGDFEESEGAHEIFKIGTHLYLNEKLNEQSAKAKYTQVILYLGFLETDAKTQKVEALKREENTLKEN